MKKVFTLVALLAFTTVVTVGCGKKEKVAEKPAISVAR